MGRAFAEIDASAITHNTRVLSELAGSAEVCAVVKANGYGHGLVTTATAAVRGGATRFGVAHVDEGRSLREAGFDEPIWLFSEPEPDEFLDCLRFSLEPPIYSERGLLAAAKVASVGAMTVHMMIDTGMHRVGCAVQDAQDWARQIRGTRGLSIDSAWTHLAVADEPGNPYTESQLDRFEAALNNIADAQIDLPLVHAANSAATMVVPRARYDVVRPGVALYGMPPSPALAGKADLRPAMRLWTTVSFVKRLRSGDRLSYGLRTELVADANIATLPIGYADGVRRGWWERGEVLIQGRRCRIVGVVTMDQLMVDCGEMEVAAGDEAVLIGAQGDEEITAGDWAQALGTINYEVTCGIGNRVQRTPADP